MSRRLKIDSAGRVEQPTFVLATKSGKKLGQIIMTSDCTARKTLNDHDEISFTVYKYDGLNVNPLWGQITDFKSIWYKEVDEWFEIQVDLDDSDSTKKNVTGVSLCEAELSQVNLNGVEINTEDDIARDDYKEPTIFYNISNHSASLLHRMLDKVPNYRIGHISSSIASMQRKFSWDGTSIYDALMDVAEECECLFVFDSSTGADGKPARIINAYDLKEYCSSCGERFDSGAVCPKCGSSKIIHGFGANTGIVVSKDNLSDNITFTTSKDDVKNCFRLVAGDDLMTAAIRTCNPNGSNYIWYITDDMKQDMSNALVRKLDGYSSIYNEYESAHNFTINADAYNNLVGKYISANRDIKYIRSAPYSGAGENDVVLSNFPNVVEAYYYAYDFGQYLQTTMMPTVEASDTNVAAEISKLEANLSIVSISNLSKSTSVETVETAVKSISKLYVNTGKYKISVSTSKWANPKWTGTVTLTNWGDETETGTTKTLSVTASSNAADYIKQQVDLKLNEVKDGDIDVKGLFSKESSDFSDRLKLYALDSLTSFSEICQTCLDVLIEQGCGSKSHEMYQSMYVPWNSKKKMIESELDTRSKEVAVITGGSGILSKLDNIRTLVNNKLNFESYIGTTLWNEFLSYRRESDYSNDNYISDGLTNAELIQNAKEFIEAAKKELYKSAELQHTITASLYNLLALPEFASLAENFAVGNWIYVIVDDIPYKLRLTEYEISYDDLQMIDVQFSDVVRVTGGLSDVKSVLDAASSMSSSYGGVMHQANQGSNAQKQIHDWVRDGLDATNVLIVSNAINQEMQFDSHGLLGRRYDDIIEQYRSEQCKMTSTTLAFTDDNWQTAKAALGKIANENGDMMYGLIAENVVGSLIAGERLVIRSALEDGTGSSVFRVDENGVSLKMKSPKTGLYFDVGNLEDEIVGMTSRIEDIDTGVDTKISQFADSITLEAGSISGGKVSITLNAGGNKKSASIDVSGLVTFTDLKTKGSTVINGSNITTGAVSANLITVGKIQDSKGNNYWNLDTGEFSLSSATKVGGKTVYDISSTAAADAVSAYDVALGQQETLKKLTDNGKSKGIYLKDGDLFVNASYIKSGAIDASLIKSGSIDAGDVTLTGDFTVYNKSDNSVGGHLGFMLGSTESTWTSGIGFTNKAQDCYSIVTESGTRIHAGSYSVYVTKSGVARISGNGGMIEITPNGDNGAGVYITGRLFRRGSESSEWTSIT